MKAFIATSVFWLFFFKIYRYQFGCLTLNLKQQKKSYELEIFPKETSFVLFLIIILELKIPLDQIGF